MARLGLALVLAVVVFSVVIGSQLFAGGQANSHNPARGAIQSVDSHTEAVSLTPGIPSDSATPPFYVLLNGSTTYSYYTVVPGDNITVVIQITAPQTVSLNLSASQQITPGNSPVAGIVLGLANQTVTAPISGILMYVDIGTNVAPGTYPMAVVAAENTGGTEIGFSAGFNLIVQSPQG